MLLSYYPSSDFTFRFGLKKTNYNDYFVSGKEIGSYFLRVHMDLKFGLKH